MKYEAGDRVKIRQDFAERANMEKKRAWAGKTMTIATINSPRGYYLMIEDELGFCWHDDEIEGPAEPEMSGVEVLKLAIDTYGEDEQIRVCQEEMNELGVAFSKYHRCPSEETRRNVQEEIADACVMMQQAKMMFGEKEVNKITLQKIQRLKERLEDEREVETVDGRHSVNGKTYTWINPDGATVKIGHIAIAETSKGHMPIIVTHVRDEKMGNVKRHKKIIAGGLNE